MIITGLEKKQGDFSLSIKSLDLSAPGVYGLIGPNGCGKSTTAKLLAGVAAPDRGTIGLQGLDPRDITLLPQKPYMMRDTVYRNLIYPLQLRKMPIDEAGCRAQLDRAGFRGRYQQQARSLSSGERQKLAVLRALIFRPKFIIADEAMSGMDIDSLDMFERLILDQQRKENQTWLIISHQMGHIKRLCKHLFFMDQGSIAAEGAVEDMLCASPSNAQVARYLRAYGGL